ncbi:MAG: virulence RhuM family protein [Clostridia bacterium]|nr:virulence RhuM family protein [Clostridia bacterium]
MHQNNKKIRFRKKLKRIFFLEKELDKSSVTEKFSVTAADGKNYNTQCYNLDAIIAVGYRVNSKKATRFRQWATKYPNYM